MQLGGLVLAAFLSLVLTACLEPVGDPLRDSAVSGWDAASIPADASEPPPDVGRADAAEARDASTPDGSLEPLDASGLDGCTPETNGELCSALGLTCGAGNGIDNCGIVRSVDCGTCGTLPLCGPFASEPCERICGVNGFCWAFPQPMGGVINGIDGVSASDVWFVGAFGATLHWDGSSLKRIPSGTTAELRAVKAFSSTEVWATGRNFNITDSMTIRWDGAAWRPVPGVPEGGEALWGSSPDDVWIADKYHWDGATWTDSCAYCGYSAFATMWGSSATDVWYYEMGNTLFHFDGSAWHETPSNDARSFYWVLGGIAGSSSTDVFAGSGDLFVHWDGAAWSPAASPSSEKMTSAFARGPDVWTLFGTEAYRRNAAGWDFVTSLPFEEHARRLWTDGAEFWFGNPSLLRWDGATFTSFQQSRHGVSVAQTWGTARDTWAVSCANARVSHWTGSDWTAFDLSSLATSLCGIAGSAPDDIWAVGDAGAVVHWDGSTWSKVASPTTRDLSVVVATAANDVWAAGGTTSLLHWNGTAWTATTSPSTNSVKAFWSSSSSSVWAATGEASLLHFDGLRWRVVAPPCPPDTELSALWGSRADDLWAFGDYSPSPPFSKGIALHWDGAAWSSHNGDASGYAVACGRDSLEFLFSPSSMQSWTGTGFGMSTFVPTLSYTPPHGCAVDDSGDLWLFLANGGVLQRSGRWR